MNKQKKQQLKSGGWQVGSAREFLGLSEEEIRLIETKRALIRMVKDVRLSNSITQEKLAEMIQSSQSRIAKMEAASPDVSLDLVFRALFALGVSQRKLAKVLADVN